MSRSTRRATARIDCRGVCVKRLINGSVLGTSTAITPNCVRLCAAFETESIQQQQDHRAYNRCVIKDRDRRRVCEGNPSFIRVSALALARAD